MSSPGTIRFAEVGVKPPAPPVGYCIMYFKDDNVLYLQDSSGVEIALGTTSSITQLSGEATAMGPGNATVTLSNSAVIGKVLTGFTAGPDSAVLATDTLLEAIQKLQAQVSTTSGAAISELTGDVVAVGPGSVTATIQSNVVSNSKLAQMPAATFKGNDMGITANAQDLTVAEVVDLISDIVVTQIPDQANDEGTTAFVARADHIHEIPSGPAVQIGTTNFPGSAQSFSLSDHVHAHGNQTSGTLHAAASTSVNGFMSAADKVKLDASTSTNTPSTLVLRDSSGDFSAGIITATLNGSAGSFSGSLVGDVTGTQGATVVSTVGGKTAAEVSTSVDDTLAATNLSTVSTIAKRDGSGATHLKTLQLDGATSGTLAVTVPAITTNHTLTLPAAQGVAGTYLANDGAGNLSWSNPVVNIDGGSANSVYVASQTINGGTA